MFTASVRYLVFATVATAAVAAIDFDHEIILTPPAGTSRQDIEIRRWQEQITRADAKRADYERLGWAFVAKARRTLDAGYYKLAEKTADVMEARFGAGADSRLLRGHIDHNLHRFHEAEEIARKLVAERGEPDDFALLSDALMEQGKLDEAIAALQQLANLRPGAEADSRIAHVRWLRGDLPGAIAAMASAVRESDPRDEETIAWMLARLSGYQLQAGDTAQAAALAVAALHHAPDFPPALLANGRALLAAGKDFAALAPLRRAAELNPLPEYQWWLADALRRNGREREVVDVEGQLIARGESSDPRTLALFLATRGKDAPTALRLARAELATRADVLTHDAIAWALAASGDFPAAAVEMSAALAGHTRDARMFFHAAVIARAGGRTGAAVAYLDSARRAAGTLTPSERAQLDTLLTESDVGREGAVSDAGSHETVQCEGQHH